MDSYRVRQVRALVNDEWVDLTVGEKTVFELELPGDGIYRPGQSSDHTGYWAVRGLVGFPVSIANLSVIEVEIETTDGQRWRGPSQIDIDPLRRLTLSAAGDLLPC